MVRLAMVAAAAILLVGLLGVRIAARTLLLGPGVDEPPLKLPAWWKAGDPLPREKTNCVRCHLTAGRELTAPVRDFAQGAHDYASLSCNDCHGGDTEHDATAHEHDKGFIGTKLTHHIAGCTECHGHEATAFRKSKHYWDLKKSINKDYPMCVDCHGNHDVGRPPADFALAGRVLSPTATRTWPLDGRAWPPRRRKTIGSGKPCIMPPGGCGLSGRLAHLPQGAGASPQRRRGVFSCSNDSDSATSRRPEPAHARLREGLQDWLKQQKKGRPGT